MLGLVLFYAIYSSSSPLGKILINHAGAFFIVGMRGVLAGLVLSLYVRFIMKRETLIQTRSLHDVWELFAISFFTMFLPNVLRFWALNYITTIKVALFYALSPFLTYTIAYAMGVERMTKKKSIGILIGSCGFIPLFIQSTALENSLGTIGYFSFPEIAMILAVASDAFGLVITSRVIKRGHYAPAALNAITMPLGGLFSLLGAAFIETMPAPHDFWIVAGLLSLITLISNVFSYTMYAYFLRFYSASFLSLCDFMRAFFSSLYGWFFLSEVLSMHSLLAGAIVLVGLIIFYGEEMKDNPSFVTPSFAMASQWLSDYRHSIYRAVRFGNRESRGLKSHYERDEKKDSE